MQRKNKATPASTKAKANTNAKATTTTNISTLADASPFQVEKQREALYKFHFDFLKIYKWCGEPLVAKWREADVSKH